MADKILVNSKYTGKFTGIYLCIFCSSNRQCGVLDRVSLITKIIFFAAGIFHDTFTSLNIVPDVVYPSLHTKAFDEELSQHHSTLDHQKESETFLLLSINRYERKKNLPLALKTLGMTAY